MYKGTSTRSLLNLNIFLLTSEIAVALWPLPLARNADWLTY